MIYCFRPSEGGTNFGDELNIPLWETLLPHDWLKREDTLLLGIGSYLQEPLPDVPKRVIFGSGVCYGEPPKLTDRDTVYFVRGPITAEVLELDPSKAITDPAILLRMLICPPAERHRGYYMPHWQEMEKKPLAVDNYAERHFVPVLNPQGNVHEIIKTINGAAIIHTSALHGAIVADALRVPWIPVEPKDKNHLLKWLDFAASMDMKLEWGKESLSTDAVHMDRLERVHAEVEALKADIADGVVG